MINLLYCGNLDMFDGVMLSLLSALDKTSAPITAYVMSMDLRDINERYSPFLPEHIEILNTVVKRSNPENSVVLLDATQVFLRRLEGSANIDSGYTPYALLRLLSCEFDLPEKLLYVDTDIMFNGDVAQILDYDIEDYELAGVVDHLGKRFIAKDYMNTGVLYLNMTKIRQTRLFDRALDMCLNNEMVFPDQDAINEALEFKLFLPAKFNEQHKLKKDTVIQHFSKTIRFFPLFRVINVKQWQIESVHKILKIHVYDDIYQRFLAFRSELGEGLLKPFVMTPPMTRRQLRKYSYKELKSFLTQNGGVFRKKKR